MPSALQTEAKRLMGKNYLPVFGTAWYMGNSPLSVLGEVPFSKNALDACKDTHMLVPVFALSIEDMLKRFSHLFERNSTKAWFEGRSFARDKGHTRWHLIRRGPAPGTNNLPRLAQVARLSERETVPSARVLVYAMILNHLNTTELLYTPDRVRSCSRNNGRTIAVGFSEKGRIVITSDNQFPHANLGLGSECAP